MTEGSAMRGSVNIDIGGTFTDCYVQFDGRTVMSKVPTTRYDLPVGFNEAVRHCAEELGLSVKQLLGQADLVRYATTLAMNALIERTGPKLGLITTAGFEDTIYIGRGAQWHDPLPLEFKRVVPRARRPEPLITRDMVVGIRERVDCFGRVIIPAQVEEIREKVQQLVDKGATGFVTSLLWSFVNPAHERLVRQVILEEYPESYLGSHAILLASEVMPKWKEYERTMTAILAAYLHRTMAEELTTLSYHLHEQGYQKPLYIVHNTGGCAPLHRTSAVNTYNAGPVAGLMGTARLAEVYGFENAIATDMGGTSFDIGLLAEGGVRRFYPFVALIDAWRVGISMVETKSIGAGGGSIARFNRDLEILEVGPQSAGALPGPACFDLGGSEPTVTDADVALGYINPDYFVGGAMKLNKELAVAAVRDKIAEPMGMSVEQAAWAIKRVVDASMGNEIFKETNLKGYDPRDFVIFAYGGAGPTHCCGYAEYIEAPTILTSPLAPVFSAFGISAMDFAHIYEESRVLRLYDPSQDRFLEDYDIYNAVVEGLQREALRDMGMREGKIQFRLELDMRYGLQPHTVRLASPRLTLASAEDVQTVHQAFTEEYARLFGEGSAYPQGGVEILNFALWAFQPVPALQLPTYDLEGESPSAALVGERPVYWGEAFRNTPVYRRERLRCGNAIHGPAIIEAVYTTYVIPEGKRFSVDRYGNGLIEDER